MSDESQPATKSPFPAPALVDTRAGRRFVFSDSRDVAPLALGTIAVSATAWLRLMRPVAAREARAR